MQSVWQAAAALLISAGILALIWLSFGRLLLPMGNAAAPVWTVIRARGDAAALEQTVRGLLWLKDTAGTGCTIVIADDGLNDCGLAVARALVRRWPQIQLRRLEELHREIQNST